jgi:DNA-binding NtrC family response regulator/tetratricopeptide (TPR) repeat protein
MSEGHAERLIAVGSFREASNWLSGKSQLTHFEHVLKAWVEFEIGDAKQAYVSAISLLKSSPNATSQAHCLAIAGRALGRSGSPHEGLGLIRKAIAIAAKTNQILEAQLLGIYANCVLSWVGPDPALVELPKVRDAAERTGDRRALVEYHLAHAHVAVLKGAPQTALEEIRRADNLLEVDAYSDLRWRLQETRANAALQDDDVQAARSYAEECLRLAQDSGSKRRIANTFGNLAHIAATLGDFESAKYLLSQCLVRLDLADPARLAALSTGLTIGSATRDQSYVSEIVQQSADTNDEGNAEQSYYRLWFEVSRARCLVDSGAAERALTLAQAAIPEVTRLADKELFDRFRLLISEALLKSGSHAKATDLFGAVCGESRHLSLILLTEVLRVAALLAADPNTARRALTTGYRLLTSAGLLGVRAHFETTTKALGIRFSPEAPAGRDEATDLVSVGVLLKLGRQPKALGNELLKLLQGHRVCESAYMVEEDENATRQTDPSVRDLDPRTGSRESDVKVFLGSTSRSKYWLCGRRPTSVDAHLLWGAVAQIIRAATAVDAKPSEDVQATSRSSLVAPTIQYGMLVAGERSSELIATSRKLAPSNITVLITGETGTGKELLARALHDASPRNEKPFIPFNCSAVSRDMLDAQLFGYRKGAFTGAHEAFQGVIRAAAGGTLFLDEIGELTLDVQPKLLRFLESGDIHPLGEPRPLHVDVRVVTATNADLAKLVSEGRFREDLFYRLDVVRLQVPPLRERREEIPPLVHHFLERCSRESHKHGIRIAEETMEYLILYSWPGNVRQLMNEMRRMVALAESGAILMPEHLSASIAASRRTIPASERPLAPTEVVVRLDQPMSAGMEHLERTMIQYALRESGGRVEDAAQRLGLSRKGLYLKRQRLGIELTDERPLVHQ